MPPGAKGKSLDATENGTVGTMLGVQDHRPRPMEPALRRCENELMGPEAAGLIAVDPEVLHGQAHVRGTRIPVSVVLDAIAAGMSEGDPRRVPHADSRGDQGRRELRDVSAEGGGDPRAHVPDHELADRPARGRRPPDRPG